MSKPPKFDFKAAVAGIAATADTTPAEFAESDREVVRLKPRRPAPATGKGGGTLKERAHQLSVYLEMPVYNALRDVAHAEHAKLHALVLEGIDLVLRKRGQPSIRELMKASGA